MQSKALHRVVLYIALCWLYVVHGQGNENGVCYVDGDRCAGEAFQEAVEYRPCCNPSSVCVVPKDRDDIPNTWGSYCVDEETQLLKDHVGESTGQDSDPGKDGSSTSAPEKEQGDAGKPSKDSKESDKNNANDPVVQSDQPSGSGSRTLSPTVIGIVVAAVAISLIVVVVGVIWFRSRHRSAAEDVESGTKTASDADDDELNHRPWTFVGTAPRGQLQKTSSPDLEKASHGWRSDIEAGDVEVVDEPENAQERANTNALPDVESTNLTSARQTPSLLRILSIERSRRRSSDSEDSDASQSRVCSWFSGPS